MDSTSLAGNTTSYGYNGLRTRVSEAGDGGSRTYKRDGAGVTAPVLSDTVSTMVPRISERTSGVTKTVATDRLGSIKAMVNPAQTVTDTANYDAFGTVLSRTGTTPTQKGFAAGWGYQEDGETNFKLLGHRYYDPASGRFLTRDPIGSGTNWYAYCDNNPIKLSDPAGLRPVTDADKARLHKLQADMRKQGMSDRYINEITAELKAQILAVPDRSQDPDRLKALWWAIDQLGTSNYGKDGGGYHCNWFVSDAYAVGAGVGYESSGGSFPDRGNKLFGGTKHVGSQTLAENGRLSNLEIVANAEPGDIVSFADRDGHGGHTTLKVGRGLLIYAGENGSKTQTYGYVRENSGPYKAGSTKRRFKRP